MQTCSSSAEGGETQKRKKHRSKNFMMPLPTSVQVMGSFLDKGPQTPNPSLQGGTADIKRHRNLSHFLEAEFEGLKFITYSRRSSKGGHMRKKKNKNTCQENFQKNVFHNRNSSIVNPAETSFRIKSLLGVYGKEDGSMREGMHRDRASTISTDGDQNKANFSGSETNKFTRWRWQRKRKNRTSHNARHVLVSEQRESVNDLHRSPECTPKIPAVKWSLSSTSGTRTSNSCSGLKAEDSGAESPAREISVLIVENPPSEVALHVESSRLVVSKEGGVAKKDAQAAGLESTFINISPPISEEEPPPAVEPVCRVASSLAYGTSKASQSLPALGVEWPDGPQFGLALGSPEVAAQLVQSLDLLLQVDPLPTVEAMRSKLEECTRGYHAFGLPRDTWMAKLAALWDEFAYLHASQEQRQRTNMMIQQEEEMLYRLRATQAEVHTQIEAARDCGWRAAFRAKELKRKVQALLRRAQVAEVECSSAQDKLQTLQCKLGRLQGKVLLNETRFAELRRRGS